MTTEMTRLLVTCLLVLSVRLNTRLCVTSRRLEVKLTEVSTNNKRSGFFLCSTTEKQNFFLNNVLTWSKRGRDGKEKLLSVNLQLVEKNMQRSYSIASTTDVSSNKTFFALTNTNLTAEDNGEYLCRILDSNKVSKAEEKVNVVVFDSGLAMSPYRVEGTTGQAVAINCMLNEINPVFYQDHVVYMNHIDQFGNYKRLSENDALIDSAMDGKLYAMVYKTDENGLRHYVLTVKGLTKSDEGMFICGIKRKTGETVAVTNISVTVDAPKLKISPMYYILIPTGMYANFQCACLPGYTEYCQNYTLYWSLQGRFDKTFQNISSGNQLIGDPEVYNITQVGSAINMSILAAVDNQTEGDFICSLKDDYGKELASTSAPVTISPITLGALATTHTYPISVRLLCAVGGTAGSRRYMSFHSLIWSHKKQGVETPITRNGQLADVSLKEKYTVLFDASSHFVILDIFNLRPEDNGEYICRLENSKTGNVLREKQVEITGKDTRRLKIAV